MSAYRPLTPALEGFFEKKLRNLPKSLRERVKREIPVPWDQLSVDGRRNQARVADYRDDPTTKVERTERWGVEARKKAIKKKIAEWEVVGAPNGTDKHHKDTRLEDLNRQLADIEKSACPVTPDRARNPRHLDHDPVLQKLANEIASAKAKETGRPPTRNKVADMLAKEVGMTPETVLRRIRKKW